MSTESEEKAKIHQMKLPDGRYLMCINNVLFTVIVNGSTVELLPNYEREENHPIVREITGDT